MRKPNDVNDMAPTDERTDSHLGAVESMGRKVIRSIAQLLSSSARKSFLDEHHASPSGDESNVCRERFTILDTALFGIEIIHVVRPDAVYHDHPWGGVGLVLSGGYTERVFGVALEQAERPVRWLTRINPHGMHMITSVKAGTWVLVVRKAQEKGRGYLVNLEGEQGEYVMPEPYAGDKPEQVPQIVQ